MDRRASGPLNIAYRQLSSIAGTYGRLMNSRGKYIKIGSLGICIRPQARKRIDPTNKKLVPRSVGE